MFFLTSAFSSTAMPNIENNSKIVDNLIVEIPQDVLSRFYSSFIIDNRGNFLGAKVNEIREYITFSEILLLISSEGYKVSELVILDRHRPRRFGGGCKFSNDWICQFEDPLDPKE